MRRTAVVAGVAAAGLLIGAPAGGSTTAAAIAEEAPSISVGGDAGRDRWRLQGRRLTVRLARPLPRTPGERITIDVRCGERALPLAEYGRYLDPAFADVARARLRASRTPAVLRLRLDRDVAARTTWCELSSRSRGDAWGWRGVAMRPQGGPPTGCARGRRERVALDTSQVLVTRSRHGNPDTGTMAYRACERSDGRLRPLDHAIWGGGGGGSGASVSLLTADGTRIAWVHQTFPHDGSDGPLRIRTRDLARSGASPTDELEAVPGQGAPNARVAALAVAADETVAWVVTRRLGYPAEPQTEIEELYAHGRAGRIVLLDAGAPGSLTRLAVAAGATVTWSHGAERRTATVP